MKAIVYTSNTGHTAAYAEILGRKTGLPVYTLDHARKVLQKGTPIIYMGWLFANSLKGYRRAAKRFDIRAVCGVGLCDTGCLLEEVRRSISLSQQIPLFTMQGGMDKTRLHGVNRWMIGMLMRMLRAKKDRTQDDERMLTLLETDANYVDEKHTDAFMKWYSAN